MRNWQGRIATGLAIALLAIAPEARAVSLVRMSLDDLCGRAGQIVRGRVLGSVEGTVEVGGGKLPVTTYRLQIDETFKGPASAGKKGAIIELRMLAPLPELTVGNVQFVGAIRDLPKLEEGASYLLFSTQPSAIGLSTTVGLGQGCFRVSGGGGREMVANGFNNAGLFTNAEKGRTGAQSGPVPYERLAKAIRASLASR